MWRGLLVASRHHAAVDVPDGAGHPAGFGGQQEGDGGGEGRGGADPSERVEAVEAVQDVVDLVLCASAMRCSYGARYMAADAPLQGRDEELRTFDGLPEAVRAGESKALVVRGERGRAGRHIRVECGGCA